MPAGIPLFRTNENLLAKIFAPCSQNLNRNGALRKAKRRGNGRCWQNLALPRFCVAMNGYSAYSGTQVSPGAPEVSTARSSMPSFRACTVSAIGTSVTLTPVAKKSKNTFRVMATTSPSAGRPSCVNRIE